MAPARASLAAMPRTFAPWGGQSCPQPAFSRLPRERSSRVGVAAPRRPKMAKLQSRANARRVARSGDAARRVGAPHQHQMAKLKAGELRSRDSRANARRVARSGDAARRVRAPHQHQMAKLKAGELRSRDSRANARRVARSGDAARRVRAPHRHQMAKLKTRATPAATAGVRSRHAESVRHVRVAECPNSRRELRSRVSARVPTRHAGGVRQVSYGADVSR